MTRKSFFKSVASVVAIISLAPEVAFRTVKPKFCFKNLMFVSRQLFIGYDGTVKELIDDEWVLIKNGTGEQLPYLPPIIFRRQEFDKAVKLLEGTKV